MSIEAPKDPPKPITHRRVLGIAIPIILSNLTVPIVGAVDVGVIGRMGEAAPIGGVALGAVILASAYWAFGFLRMGTVGLAGQAQGAGDHDEVTAILVRALIISLGGGLLLILALPLFTWLAFVWEPASPDVEDMARTYLSIRIYTAPCAIAVFAISGWLLAMERAKAVFAVQFVINGINILLDLWFVLGLGWGVGGVAAATAIAETIGAIYGLWLCRDAFARPAWKDRARILDRDRLMHLARLNADILVRSLLLTAMIVLFTFQSARFGDVTLAVNHVLLQFLSFVAFGMDGVAFAAESLVARAIGRRDPSRFRRASYLCALWGAVLCLLFALAFALTGGMIIDLMTTAEDVRAEGRIFLIYIVLCPIAGFLPWLMDGIFIGAARGPDMRNMMILSFAIYAAAFAALVPLFGNHGLWVAMLISFVARGLTLMWRFPRILQDLRASEPSLASGAAGLSH